MADVSAQIDLLLHWNEVLLRSTCLLRVWMAAFIGLPRQIVVSCWSGQVLNELGTCRKEDF